MQDNVKVEVKGFDAISVNFEKSRQEAIKDSAFISLDELKLQSSRSQIEKKRITSVLGSGKQSKKTFRFRADMQKIKYFFQRFDERKTEVTPKMRRFLGAKGVPVRKETTMLVRPEIDDTDMVIRLPHAVFYRTAFLKRIQKNFKIV